jgi:hypothetical protein
MNAARNSNMLTMPSHIQTLVKTATKAECIAPIDHPSRAPMRFMPMLKNKFPAELRATSSATTIDVLKVWVWGDVMNVRSGVARGNGGIIFALFLLVLSSLEIARLESMGRQAG